jgi:hypothetical protein
MPTIKCRNTRNEKGTVVTCNRFLIQLPQCVIDSLTYNPEEKIIVRCPTCPRVVRWAAVYYRQEVGFIWEVIKNPKNFDKDFTFDHVINCEEVTIENNHKEEK